MFQITSVKLNISALNETISDVSYFNILFNTDDCIVTEIPNLTPKEIATNKANQDAEIALNKKKQVILDQLDVIDGKSIRAIRTNDTQRISDLENQAISLRTQLASLT
jgi:hypothetical protein